MSEFYDQTLAVNSGLDKIQPGRQCAAVSLGVSTLFHCAACLTVVKWQLDIGAVHSADLLASLMHQDTCCSLPDIFIFLQHPLAARHFVHFLFWNETIKGEITMDELFIIFLFIVCSFLDFWDTLVKCNKYFDTRWFWQETQQLISSVVIPRHWICILFFYLQTLVWPKWLNTYFNNNNNYI